jgi:hypothetical protein
MLTSLILAAAIAGQPSAPGARGQVEGPRVRPGDAARVNALDSDGRPIPVVIDADPGAARRQISAAGRAARRGVPSASPGVPSAVEEGTLLIVHNTPVRVERLDEVDVDGKILPLAQVTVGAGALKGPRYWISARRLRPAGVDWAPMEAAIVLVVFLPVLSPSTGRTGPGRPARSDGSGRCGVPIDPTGRVGAGDAGASARLPDLIRPAGRDALEPREPRR